MGKSTPNPPEPPRFDPVSIPDALARALSYDTQGYDFADADMLARFPGLVATRSQEMDRAYQELTGPLNPTVSSSFTRQGLSQGAASTGGGDPLSGLGLTTGSAGRNAASVSFANNALAKEDADRQYFSQLLASNPQRSFGLGGGDLSAISALNTGGTNSVNSQMYQSQLAGIYGSGQQDVATGAQIAALGAMLARMGG